jgi:hypothetical protein
MSVLQSGNVTPGHGVKWVSDNVIGDNGANPYSQRVLATLLSANFNTTTDQPIVLPPALNYFQLTGIIVAGASLSLTTAIGGFYPQAAQAGSALVNGSQTYSALTTSLLLTSLTLTAYAQAQRFSRNQLPDWAIYFSLTTPQGVEAFADIYLLGIELG